MPRVILLLGAPTAETLVASSERPTLAVLPAFQDPALFDVEKYIGALPIPSISTHDPDQSGSFTWDHGGYVGFDEEGRGGRGERRKWSTNRRNRISGAVPASELPNPWRILPWTRPALHTGFTQRSFGSSFRGEASTTRNIFADDHDGEEAAGYLENSYAAYNIPTSQISVCSAVDSEEDEENDDDDDDDGFGERDSTTISSSRPPLPHLPLASLTSLGNIPTAETLEKLRKVSTVNLLVGIASIPEPRVLRTRSRWSLGAEENAELNTLVVGDETAAGFEVNVWLPFPNNNNNINNNQGTSVARVKSLKTGDIILLENIALSAYKGFVSGNTLRRDRSKITLVYRDESGKRADLRGNPDDPQVLKVREIREWVRDRVWDPNIDGSWSSWSSSLQPAKGRMPDDTQIE